MKLATFNVNGIRTRLPHLLQWLSREAPDIVCLQELKAAHKSFPAAQIRDAGYGAIWQGQEPLWNGVAILARGTDPIEVRRGLPGQPSDKQSRYLEAAVQGILVGCLYLPNGNPRPGPKFDYKLAWFERLIAHAKAWRKDALLQPQTRECYRRMLDQGWLDALRSKHPKERIYTFWDYFRQHWQRDAGLRIDHLLLNRTLAPRLRKAGVDRWVRGLERASDHAPAWVTLA